jgi:glycerol kinase
MASAQPRIDCIGSVDQGTSSTRFILFNQQGDVIDSHQVEIAQIYTDGETGYVRASLRTVLRMSRG